MRNLCRASAGIFVLIGTTSAMAQERLFRSVDVAAGKQVRLGMVGNVTPQCTIGPKPELKVLTPPKHGVLALRSGTTKPGMLGRCPKLEVPAEGVFYQAPAGFSGSDELVYQVTRADGRNQVVTVKITVQAATAPRQPQKPEATDL